MYTFPGGEPALYDPLDVGVEVSLVIVVGATGVSTGVTVGGAAAAA